MGAAMAGHLLAKGHEVTAFDVDAAKLRAAAERGIATVSSLEALAKTSEIFLAVVSTDEQSASVTGSPPGCPYVTISDASMMFLSIGVLVYWCATHAPPIRLPGSTP